MRPLSIPALVLLTLVGCADKGEDTDTLDGEGDGTGIECTDPTTWFADRDEDGYGDAADTLSDCEAPSGYVDDATDCDDGEAEVHPGADELCNGADDDCDEDVDEDAVDQGTWYADADEDGYGDPTAGTTSCEPPSGTVEDGTDCDDTLPEVNPGASEYCNDIDDDCNDEVDEGEAVDATTLYADTDGDSYGDPETGASLCPAEGRVSDGSDCDDTEASVNPGETEICSDGLDNDCDGSPNDCLLEGNVTSGDADQAIVGALGYDYLGYSVSSVGDMDGDGFEDLMVGALYGDAGGVTNSGSAYLYLGSATGLATTAVASVSGVAKADYFGASMGGLGDTDGDGYPDLVVGASHADSGTHAGAAWVFLGPLSAGNTPAEDGDAEIRTTDEESYLGWRTAGPGDIDGDGYTDLVVTAPGAAPNGTDATGEAWVFLGPVSGTLGRDDATARLMGSDDGDWAGGASSQVGDLDGDGLDDLAISGEKHTVSVEGEGQVYVWTGLVSGDLDLADATTIINGVAEGDAFGWEQSGAGDVDGDGYLDLAVSSVKANGAMGAGWLFLGPLSAGTWSASLADATFEGVTADQAFGYRVQGGGDFDGDGLGDLAFSSVVDDGEAYLFYAPASGAYTSADADLTITGDGSEKLGFDMTLQGDLDGDGLQELVITANRNSSAATNGGAVYLFYGTGW